MEWKGRSDYCLSWGFFEAAVPLVGIKAATSCIKHRSASADATRKSSQS